MNEETDKLKARQTRYLRDGVPVRLGNLASNLARLSSFAQTEAMREAAARVVQESRLFIEWTVADAAPPAQTALRALDDNLAHWQRHWPALWADPAQRQTLRTHAEDWSKKLLEHSGLLQPLPPAPH